MKHIATLFWLLVVLAACSRKEQQPWADLSFPEVPDSIRYNDAKITFLRWEDCPVQFFTSEPAEQLSWLGVAGTQQVIRIFPNYATRREKGITEINKITGAAHFFLDMDLTTGYVHPYTVNFFNKLRPDDYVMRYTMSETDSATGLMSFVKKSTLAPGDVLGKNIAFFRQWRLSELEIKTEDDQTYVNMKPCDYAKEVCNCPTVRRGSDNPFSNQVPFWHAGMGKGYTPLSALNKTGRYDGGNVILVWPYGGQTWFQGMRGSLQQVLTQAFNIKEKCNCDPVLAISDAGPMSAGLKSDADFRLQTALIDELDRTPYVGAGFGYFPSKVGVYFYKQPDGSKREFVVTF